MSWVACASHRSCLHAGEKCGPRAGCWLERSQHALALLAALSDAEYQVFAGPAPTAGRTCMRYGQEPLCLGIRILHIRPISVTWAKTSHEYCSWRGQGQRSAQDWSTARHDHKSSLPWQNQYFVIMARHGIATTSAEAKHAELAQHYRNGTKVRIEGTAHFHYCASSAASILGLWLACE
jgi:hypothetical protein